MSNIYVSYKCKSCNKEIILINDEVLSTIAKGSYLVCSHCSSKRLILEKSTDDLRECMKHSSYKRVHGSIKQVK